jgi:hypothetical protein
MAAVRADEALAPARLGPASELAAPVDVAGIHRRVGGWAVALRVSLVLACCLLAYHETLGTLLGSYSPARPLSYLGWVPVLAVLAAAARALAGDRGPEIHDRYLDYIVGLPLLATALAAMVLLPARLSVYFWYWRLDLLALPLFCAGSISLVFGVRALWRFRGAILLLFVAWPLPFARSLEPVRPVVGAIMLLLAALTLLAAPSVFGFSEALRVLRNRVGRRPLLGAPAARPSSPAVRRAGIALSIVAIAAVLAFGADTSLRQSAPLIQDDGLPRIAGLDLTGAVPGWTLAQVTPRPNAPRYFGAGALWTQYAFASTGTSFSPGQVTVDVVSTPDAAVLARHGMGLFDRLQAYRLVSSGNAELGAGVVGQIFVYGSESQQATWYGVSWQWPVLTGTGVRYERLVIHMTLLDGATVLAPGTTLSAPPAGFAAGVADWLDGVQPDALSGTSRQARDFLVFFSREMVASTLGRAA